MARTRASDFEEKQHGILISAAAVFARQGMEKASMAQIARHGVSKALLYHYYPSKDVLLFAIIHTHLAELEASVAAAVDRHSPEDQLGCWCRWCSSSTAGADDAHKVQLTNACAFRSSSGRDPSRRAADRAAASRPCCERINPKLDNPDRPLLMPVTMSLFGMLNWVYMWFRDGGPITREDYAEVATTLILEGIKGVRRGGQSPSFSRSSIKGSYSGALIRRRSGSGALSGSAGRSLSRASSAKRG